MPEPVNNEQLDLSQDGGNGGLARALEDRKHLRQTLKDLEDLTLSDDWDIPAEARAELGSRMWELVNHDEDGRVRVAAAKVLTSMGAHNRGGKLAILDRIAPKPSATPAGGGGSGGPPIINVQVVNVQQEPR